MLPNHYLTEKYIKVHHWELQREFEQARLAASVSPRRNVVRQGISKLEALLAHLSASMKHKEQAKQSPKPVTGSLY